MKKLITSFILLLVFLNSDCQNIIQDIDSINLLRRLCSYHTDNVNTINYKMFTKYNTTNNVRKKLFSLLKNEWSIEDLNNKVNRFYRENFDNAFFNSIRSGAYTESEEYYSINHIKMHQLSKSDTTQNISNQYFRIFDSIYKKKYDSCSIIFKSEIERKIKESPVPKEIILATGKCSIKEAVPILEEKLKSTSNSDSIEPIKLALALLGNNMLLKSFFERHNRIIKNTENIIGSNPEFDSDFFALTYIGTQESVCLIKDWLDTSWNKSFNKYPEGNPSKGKKVYAANFVVYGLMDFLKNTDFLNGIHSILKNEYDWEYFPPEAIIFTRSWLIKNKGKYLF